MATSSLSSSRPDPRGLAYALTGLLLWGLSPLYWKLLAHVPTSETLLHRILWSAVVFAPWAFYKRRREAAALLKDGPTLRLLLATTLLIGGNWYAFLWAVNHGRVIETSLGYFMCPLFNIALGRFLLGERMTRLQGAAVALAALAVLSLVAAMDRPAEGGRAPVLALLLASTFSAYAVLRKLARVEAGLGLAFETLLLAAPCALALLARGPGAFAADWTTRLLLIGSVAMTGLPLLLYTAGARRLDLKTLGIAQYVSPTCQLLLGALVYGEPVEPAKLRAFALIWLAIGVYTFDMLASRARD